MAWTMFSAACRPQLAHMSRPPCPCVEIDFLPEHPHAKPHEAGREPTPCAQDRQRRRISICWTPSPGPADFGQRTRRSGVDARPAAGTTITETAPAPSWTWTSPPPRLRTIRLARATASARSAELKDAREAAGEDTRQALPALLTSLTFAAPIPAALPLAGRGKRLRRLALGSAKQTHQGREGAPTFHE